jgi:hypothetical protein
VRARLILLVVFSFSYVTPAWTECIKDSIAVVLPDQDLIMLNTSGTYVIVGTDLATAAHWQIGDAVLVCGDTIINKDEDGEKIQVTLHVG